MKTIIAFLLMSSLCFAELALQAKAKPRVSIITSVYNGDGFIEGFLKDITQQTIFKECELIMINANSPGHEEKIIKDYMAKYPNIIYVRLPQDPGVYGVWNRAIKMTSSDFIANANLDDRSHPKALEVQVEELETYPDIDLVYAGYLSTPVPNDTYIGNHASGHVDPPEFSVENNIRYCLPGPRPVWRKSLHDRYGFFDESFFSGGDYEMWVRAVNLGSKFKKVPGYYTLYYQNPKGLSTDLGDEKVERRKQDDLKFKKLYPHLFMSIVNPHVGEDFLTLYNRGRYQRSVQETDAALESFLKAYERSKVHAEPLWQCATIYREKGNVLLGYLLAKHALSLPWPKEELLLERMAYEYAITVEFANCALLLGKFEEGFEACKKLLVNPQLPVEFKPQVESNYELAKMRLEEASSK